MCNNKEAAEKPRLWFTRADALLLAEAELESGVRDTQHLQPSLQKLPSIAGGLWERRKLDWDRWEGTLTSAVRPLSSSTCCCALRTHRTPSVAMDQNLRNHGPKTFSSHEPVVTNICYGNRMLTGTRTSDACNDYFIPQAVESWHDSHVLDG